MIKLCISIALAMKNDSTIYKYVVETLFRRRTQAEMSTYMPILNNPELVSATRLPCMQLTSCPFPIPN